MINTKGSYLALFFLIGVICMPGYSQIGDNSLLASSEVQRRNDQQTSKAALDLDQLQKIDRTASDKNIPMRRYERMKDVPAGYYIIVGVYKNTGNLERLIRSLNDKGLNAGSLLNPENELNYVYADRYEDGVLALSAATSGLAGRYSEKLWLLVIENDYQTSKVAEITEPITKPAIASPDIPELDIPEKTHVLGATTPQPTGQKAEPLASNQLLRKANTYFDRMWYADAAMLYEEVLSRNPEAASVKLIEQVADAHYFNSNMIQANAWYEMLYDLKKDDLSPEYLYKYSQALKGSGKYGRARRFMKLYDKKMEQTPVWNLKREEMKNREVMLDKLLNAAEIFGIKNLDVNSKYSDFAPMYYGDEHIVYASSVDSAFFKTRRYKWNEQPYLDLYVAHMNKESSALESAVKFSKKVNTKYHEAAVTFSPDHNTMYFTRNNYEKRLKRDRVGVNHLKIYRSKKINGEWTEAEEVPFNGENFSTGHPALSPDGKKLYFVSDRPGTIGDTDIFVVDVLEDGGFSDPKNLGTEINTEQKEMFPFITDEKIYFSSNGHTGLGGLDIFEAQVLEDGGFAEVKNIGKPINSKNDDFSFIINRETQSGYFASNRRGGKGDDDLYSFERLIPEEINNNAISGVITALVTGEYIPEAMVELLDENNIKLKELTSGSDGSFVFEELENNTRYRLRVRKESYSQAEEHVMTLENETVPAEIVLEKLEERIIVADGVMKLKSDKIYFDFDKFSIRDDAALELDELAEFLQEHPTMIIKIESHTDSRGPAAYNKHLSDKRAKASREYLIRKGIDPGRIESAIGYGEGQLLNQCDGSVRCTAGEHQMNRRSEFIIVSR